MATLDDVVAAVDRLHRSVGTQSPTVTIYQTQIGGGGNGSFQRMGNGLSRLFGRGNAGGAGGSGNAGGGGPPVPGAKGGGGGSALGKAGNVAGAAIAIATAMYDAAEKVKEFAKAQEDTARRLAQFSPSQAANIGQLDANRALRDLEKGEATAGSGRQLTDGINRFEEAIQPIETAILDLKNSIAGTLMDTLGSLIEWITKLVNEIRGLFGLKPLGGDGAGNAETLGEFLGRVSADEERRQKAAGRRIDAARRINAQGLAN